MAGHSFGGLCALEAARLTPNIASLLVYEPPVIAGDPDELPVLDQLDEEGMTERGHSGSE